MFTLDQKRDLPARRTRNNVSRWRTLASAFHRRGLLKPLRVTGRNRRLEIDATATRPATYRQHDTRTRLRLYRAKQSSVNRYITDISSNFRTRLVHSFGIDKIRHSVVHHFKNQARLFRLQRNSTPRLRSTQVGEDGI